jgi:hypothetical protein
MYLVKETRRFKMQSSDQIAKTIVGFTVDIESIFPNIHECDHNGDEEIDLNEIEEKFEEIEEKLEKIVGKTGCNLYYNEDEDQDDFQIAEVIVFGVELMEGSTIEQIHEALNKVNEVTQKLLKCKLKIEDKTPRLYHAVHFNV